MGQQEATPCPPQTRCTQTQQQTQHHPQTQQQKARGNVKCVPCDNPCTKVPPTVQPPFAQGTAATAVEQWQTTSPRANTYAVNTVNTSESKVKESWCKDIEQAIKRGMPDIRLPHHASVNQRCGRILAEPIKWDDIKGWCQSFYGQPVYVNHFHLGAGQIVASNNSDFAIAFFDVGGAYVEEKYTKYLFSPTVPAPRWNMLWRVNAELVQRVQLIAKCIVQSEAGLKIAVIRHLDQSAAPERDQDITVELISWEAAVVMQNSPRSPYKDVMRLFFNDNVSALGRCMVDEGQCSLGGHGKNRICIKVEQQRQQKETKQASTQPEPKEQQRSSERDMATEEQEELTEAEEEPVVRSSRVVSALAPFGNDYQQKVDTGHQLPQRRGGSLSIDEEYLTVDQPFSF